MQKEQEQEKKRLEQVAVDEKMAKKFGSILGKVLILVL